MKNIFLNFGLKSKIIYWDFNINPEENLSGQLDNLKEDLVQVEFHNINLLIDIGYYPSFSKKGKLVIMLIKDGNWNNYIERIENDNIFELQKSIDYLIDKYNLG